MNSCLTPQLLCQIKGALGVVYLRNSRALFIQRKACALSLKNRGLDGNIMSRSLLRPELISASLRGECILSHAVSRKSYFFITELADIRPYDNLAVYH